MCNVINNQNQIHTVRTPFFPVGYREQRVDILYVLPQLSFILLLYLIIPEKKNHHTFVLHLVLPAQAATPRLARRHASSVVLSLYRKWRL